MLFGATSPAAGPSRQDRGPVPPPNPDDAEVPGGQEAPRRVLIVEDEGLVAATLEAMIEGFGYVVTGVADTAAEAVALARATRPDVVLVDIRLRGGRDGISAAQEMTQAADGSGPAIVFLTANSDPATRARAAAVGARAFLTKPFHPDELEAALAAAASGTN
jgi:CheY-like chemotaxis protein